MDPELAAASVLMRRVDLTDIEAARSMIALEHSLHEPLDPPVVSDVLVEDTDVPSRDEGRVIPVRMYRKLPAGPPALPGTPATSTHGTPRLPALVFAHGGAFMTGDLDTEHERCLRYAHDVGCLVVSVDYRLAPEHPFPAGADDCFDVLAWTVDEADRLGVDRARVGVGGCSAGGALAASTALRARDLGGPRVALQLLIYPVIDDTASTPSAQVYVDTPGWDSRNNAVMWSAYVDSSSTSPYAAPARAGDLTGLPPALVLTAHYDPLRDEALDYARRLLDADVVTEILQLAGTFHGFDGAVPGAAVSQRSLDAQSSFLTRYLRPR